MIEICFHQRKEDFTQEQVDALHERFMECRFTATNQMFAAAPTRPYGVCQIDRDLCLSELVSNVPEFNDLGPMTERERALIDYGYDLGRWDGERGYEPPSFVTGEAGE